MPQERADLRNLSEQTRFRRAIALVLITLVLPGSAQVAAGSKRAGRAAWRTIAGLAAVTVAVLVAGALWRAGTLNLLVRPSTLLVVQVALVALALGWAALFVDAYRLAQPLGLERGHRLVTSVLDGVLVLTVVGALLWSSFVVSAQRDFVTSVFGSTTTSKADHGRYNVLLMGGDSGKGRIGVRPDSMTVASIDADTGRTVLIGLPRNLAKAPFPEGSAMRERFPQGFQWSGCGAECLLNGLYTYAHDHQELFPDVQDPGAFVTREAIEQITGLKINYHVMIDIAGFQRLIDAVGGIRLDVGKRVPIGGIGAPIKGYIRPGKNKRLDGYHATWFARSRAGSTDYERMTRQKCVMSAMLRQLEPRRVLTKFQGIAAASKQIVNTDVPAGQLGTFVDLALKSKRLKVSSFSAVPPLINTANPDYELIRAKVAEAITKSETVDAETAGSAPTGTTTTNPTAANRPTKRPTAVPSLPSGPDVDDVASICKVA